MWKMVQTVSQNCLPALHVCVRVEVWQCSPTVVCWTAYGDMHLKDLLGSIIRVGYCIPVPDFYLVLHGLRCLKSTIMDESYMYNLFPSNYARNIAVRKTDDNICKIAIFHIKLTRPRRINVKIPMVYFDLLYVSLLMRKQHIKCGSAAAP